MSTDMRSALSDIETGIGRLERPTMRHLNPGIDPDTARATLSRRGLELSDDLITLWQWRNGTNTTSDAGLGDLWLVPGFYLLSVEDATANFDAFAPDARRRHQKAARPFSFSSR